MTMLEKAMRESSTKRHRTSSGAIILQRMVDLMVSARVILRRWHLLSEIPARNNENAVIVSLKLSEGFGTDVERVRVLKLEDVLRAAVESQGLGELDGDEFGHGTATLHFYGADADLLLSVIEPV